MSFLLTEMDNKRQSTEPYVNGFLCNMFSTLLVVPVSTVT